MNNFVDTVFNTSATGDVIKYRIKHADTTTEDVEISCITPVTTQGTALNKVLFDSIKDDLNTRLLISNKATQAEAQAGTNTTKYLVPSTMQAKLDKMNGYTGKVINLSSETHSGDNTILNLSDLPATDNGTIIIDIAYVIGYRWNASSSSQSGNFYGAFLTFNGTNFRGLNSSANEISSSSNYVINGYRNILDQHRQTTDALKFPIRIEINLNTRTLYIDFAGGTGSPSSYQFTYSKRVIHYETLTSIVATLKREPSSGYHTLFDYSIYYSR